MAVARGSVTTRVLVAVGDTEPVELATLTTRLRPSRRGHGVVLNLRRGLVLGFLRLAWAAATKRAR